MPYFSFSFYFKFFKTFKYYTSKRFLPFHPKLPVMKPPSVPLRNLTDKSKDYKVKVKVIHKSPAKQSKSLGKARFQKLILRDGEGTKMHATLFNDEIESYEEALQRKGEYELTGATIQTVPQRLKSKVGEYQMNFNSRVKITPINTQTCTFEPQYTKLSSVIEQCDDAEDIFDVVAVVIAIGDVQPVGEGEVRHLTIFDNSIQRPMTLSAWNSFATEVVELISTPTQGLPIVGFVVVQKAPYKGVSLKTTMSTEFLVNPKGAAADALRTWVKENSTMIHSWVSKSHALQGSSSTRVITPIIEVEKRKLNTIWQDESFWINVSAPSVYESDIFCYFGCNKCGRRAYLPENTLFKCEYCSAEQSVSTPRVSFQFFVTDGEGAVKVTTFGKEAEKILGATTEELHNQKNKEDQAELQATIAATEKKQMLLHIAPSSSLTTSYVLKWVVRQVEDAPKTKTENKDPGAEQDIFQSKKALATIKAEKYDVQPEQADRHTEDED